MVRFGRLLRAEAITLRQGLFANLISSGGDLLAGIALGSMTGRLEALPGLLVLIPAAIGMRGNIFGALGSRLGTGMHTGQFAMNFKRDSFVGQNIYAASALTVVISFALAPISRIVSMAFGAPSVGVIDLVAISVVGGVLSSVFVLGITIWVAAMSARRGWDLDYVSAPLVTAAGDMVTLPALVAASFIVEVDYLSPAIAFAAAGVAIGVLLHGLMAAAPLARRILAESIPVLLLAGAVDSVAGMTIEKRIEAFIALPALFVMLPPFLENSGSLGSMLSARISSKLHTGLISASAFPRQALPDAVLLYILAAPVYLFTGIASHVGAGLVGLASPGIWSMIGISMLAGAFASTSGMLVAYYGAVATYRRGLDPDNYGVPIVTASMDVLAALSIILALVLLGFTRG